MNKRRKQIKNAYLYYTGTAVFFQVLKFFGIIISDRHYQQRKNGQFFSCMILGSFGFGTDCMLFPQYYKEHAGGNSSVFLLFQNGQVHGRLKKIPAV
jgi:hypothetical protein